MAFSHRFPSLPTLHLGRPVVLSRDGNKREVILHNGCACAPGLTRPISPTIRTVEPSSGTGGGPWVRVPFTDWHASGQITLHNTLYNHYKNVGLVGHGVIKRIKLDRLRLNEKL